MKLYLIRHGQTESNQNNLHQYETTPLSKIGEHQVQDLAIKLSKVKIDKLYTSPLTRAKQTAQTIAEKQGIETIVLDELKAIKRPSIIIGKSQEDTEVVSIKKTLYENYCHKDYHHSDEENFFDVFARVNKFKATVESESVANIIAVTHSYVIKMFLCLCIFKEALTPEEFLVFYETVNTDNASITHCEFNPQTGWKIISSNDICHLQK